ncbi:hypothetical protein [Thalassomonas sp. RHCl1]|nr:hypothetical protein [Thalassomonas sp. RHCl1]
MSERIYQQDASIEEMKEFNQLLEQYQQSSAGECIEEFTRTDPGKG